MSIATTWGTTEEERTRSFPCDALLPNANAAYYRGVTVRARPDVIFRWLCQMRVGSYSYDRPGHRSPRQLTPGLDDLTRGQRFMDVFELVDFERCGHLTLRLMFDTPEARIYAVIVRELAVSYMILPLSGSRCRLLVKLLVRYRPGPAGWCGRLIVPWLDFPMARRQLLNFKQLAEETPDGESAHGASKEVNSARPNR